jgi:hypothetical protein
VIVKALLSGTEAPVFTVRMLDRKLRWEWLRQPTPFPFAILDKVGQKAFAVEHGAMVAATLGTFEHNELCADPNLLRRLTDHLPTQSYVIKPAQGYQNIGVYAVAGKYEVLRGERFDVDSTAKAITTSSIGGTYVIEERLEDERLLRADLGGGPDGGVTALPHDFKFWMFGSTVAHVTVVRGRRRLGPSSYAVSIADCDADYTPRPTWCTPGSEASGVVEAAQLPPKPQCWDAMVASASALGSAVGAFARVDFYATPLGPVFGEFQLLFDLTDWNGEADRAIRTLWRGRDGAG